MSYYGDPLDYYGYPSSWSLDHDPYISTDGPDFPSTDLNDPWYDSSQSPLLSTAWSDDPATWDLPQFELADLIAYQDQLDRDRSLDHLERLARWQDRLRWEQLDEQERVARWRLMNASARGRLGLDRGLWPSRFGGHDADLSYMRPILTRRSLFAPPYNAAFSRSQPLRQRYLPYLACPPPDMSTALRVPYMSCPLEDNLSDGLRMNELETRLRIAETRGGCAPARLHFIHACATNLNLTSSASLTSLPPDVRAQALEDARRIRAEMNFEIEQTTRADRFESRLDALSNADQREIMRQPLDHALRPIGYGRFPRSNIGSF